MRFLFIKEIKIKNPSTMEGFFILITINYAYGKMPNSA